MDTDLSYELAVRNLEAGRYSSIRTAAKVYNLENRNLGLCPLLRYKGYGIHNIVLVSR